MTTIGERLRSAVAPGNRRRTAFYAVVLLALVPYALVAGFLPAVVLGWVGAMDFGTHQIHDMAFAGLLWLGLLGLAVQLYRPERRASVMAGVVVLWGAVAVVSLLATGFDVFLVLFGLPPLVAALLHPAREEFPRASVARISRPLAALAIVAAIPLVAFAVVQYTNQVTLGDSHAELGHWAGMAGAAVGLLGLVTLASLRHTGFRLVGWATGAFAAYFGALSLAFPAVTASNLGTTWAAAAVLWGVAVVIATEVAVRHGVAIVEPTPAAERPA